MQIEIDSTNATYGSDAIAYLCAKYDKDGNGKFDLNEVRSIVTDLQKQTKAKKAYKGFAIALFVIVVLALIAMFGTSLAANQVLKDTALDTSGKMKSMDGTPVTVDVTENPNGLFDLPGMSAAQMAHLTTLTVYVDMTADAGVGKWVQFAAKIATAYTGGDNVAYLKTMTGDTLTVDGAAEKATLKTADGVFPVAVEAPEEAGRRLFGFFGTAFPPIMSSNVYTMSSAANSIGGR
jgi:hypothetical protein